MSRPIMESVDVASAHAEAWGSYVLCTGWASDPQGIPARIEGWVESSPLDGLLRRRIPLEIRTGINRPDVTEFLKIPDANSHVGFHAQAVLPQRLHRDVELKLRLIFCTSDGRRKKVSRRLRLRTEADDSEARARKVLLDALPADLPRPDLFILGAAKCGTTSLHYALSQHPEILMSAVKEPCFFSTNYQVIGGTREYFDLFPAQPGVRRHGEASHLHFSDPEIAPRLRRLFPSARFIVILRDPAERTHSLYQHMRRIGLEILPTFEQALEEEDRRFADPRFLHHCPQAFWNFMYARSSRYDHQLERYLALFPREQFLVLSLAEWKHNPARWQAEIFRFLGVRTDVVIHAEPRNIGDRYAPMSEATSQRLREQFAGVRERVETLIGRRFEHWA